MLLEPRLSYYCRPKYRGTRDLFVVPVDTETDFASVPKIFQWLVPRTGRYTRAAVLHDYLWKERPNGLSRADADGLFRRAMAELKAPFLRRWTIWAAVRIASLFLSGFRDGPRDLPRIILLFLVPGSIVIPGGLVVGTLLLGFWALEILVFVILALLRLLSIPRWRLKPTNWPTVSWSS